MRRNEAVMVMQDILCNFTGKWIDSFVLMKSGNNEADGYNLCIKGTIDDVSIQRIRKISEENHLCIEEDDGLVIYEPRHVDVDSSRVTKTQM